MCGIVGYIAREELPREPMLESLKHRGPDAMGQWSTEVLGQHLFLGHTRLSIIDLSPLGNQPMKDADESVVLTYNGEVYNFQELKKEHLQGVAFRSGSDTEVILQLYKKMGIDCIHLLNGDFAMAIFDKRINKVFLVRDRVGVKPLYFFHNDGQLVFGSEIKAILAAGVKAKLDEDGLANYFAFKYQPQNDTLFQDIQRVAPGHWMEYDLNNRILKEHCYWRPEKQSEYSNMSYSDAQQWSGDLIEDATKIRLVSDVAIGNFLSGGLDSSILASHFKEREDIRHYCAAKSEEDIRKEGTSSDIQYAREVAKAWNIPLQTIAIGSEEASLEQVRLTLKYSDDLIADGSQIPSYLITKEASKESTVILSGMGADELFLGYAGHQLALLSQRANQWPIPFKRTLWNQMANLSPGKGSFKSFKRYLVKLGRYQNYPQHRFGLFSVVGDYRNSVGVLKNTGGDPMELFKSYFPEGQDPFESLFHFERENFLVKNLHYLDRMSMANSVESRVPFLDHRIIELAYSMPRSFKLNNFGVAKKVLKDAYRDRLPEAVLKRKKAGFGMPLRSILSNQAKVNELLDFDFFGNFSYFSIPHINNLISQHQRGDADNSSIIYALISYQEWYKMYID